MILSNNNGTFTPVAGGTGTFIGTSAAFNAVKATLPVNTVAYITDDGNGDLQPVDAITDGDMHPVTSNAVFDSLYLKGTSATEVLNISRETIVAAGTAYNYTTTATIPTDGWYKFQVQANMKDNAGVISNWVKFNVGTIEVVSVSTFQPAWNNKTNTVIIPVKAGAVVTYHAYCEAYAAGSGTDITYGNYGSVYKIV